jgi:hypothetical protein
MCAERTVGAGWCEPTCRGCGVYHVETETDLIAVIPFDSQASGRRCDFGAKVVHSCSNVNCCPKSGSLAESSGFLDKCVLSKRSTKGSMGG